MNTAMIQPSCEHCGGTTPHVGQCPRVSAIEYHPNGQIKRVEYHQTQQPVMAVGQVVHNLSGGSSGPGQPGGSGGRQC